MNDFDLHYMHYARAEELRKSAENERLARKLVKAAKATRRGGDGVRSAHRTGVADRVARALGRRHETATDTAASGNDTTTVS